MGLTNLEKNISLQASYASITEGNKIAWELRRTDIVQSLEIAKKNLEESLAINYKDGIAYAYRTIGVAHYYQMQYQLALPELQKAKSLFIELGLGKGASDCSRNIGNIYTQIGALEKARQNYDMALEIAERMSDVKAATFVKVNLALINQLKGDNNKALTLLLQCLNVLEKIGDLHSLAETHFNIGNNYLQINNLDNADFHLNKSLQLSNESNYLKGIAQTNSILGNLFFKQGDTDKALIYITEGLANALEIGEKRIASESYKELSNLYKLKGNFEKALECLERYDFMRTKLTEHDNKSLMESWQGEVEIEKSERMELQSKNKELEFAYDVIKEKNKDITDSLKYAKHIQSALLPEAKFMDEHLKNYFVYYQPKDIVSGDFYWFNYKNGKCYIVAADCTGHGVPGAFISIVSANCLYSSFRDADYTDASLMLNRVNDLFNQAIRQKYEESSVRDGMDVSLCIIDFNVKTLSFAGANHDLHIIRDKELIQFKGNKFPIGIFEGEDVKEFTEVTFDLCEGDMIYLFTDGYADQFGGRGRNEKYKRKTFKKFLSIISSYSVEEQKEALQNDFNAWKGLNEQLDDVLVMGIKI